MWWLLACASPDPPPARGAPTPVEMVPQGELSGAALQDPTGFPRFHSHPAPPGPAPATDGAWTEPLRLSEAEGGLRPQIAAGPDGALHVVYYAQTGAGDLLRHNLRPVSAPCAAAAPCAWRDFEPAVSFGRPSGRNWGPDLVARADGSAVVSWDHTEPSVSAAGAVLLSTWTRGAWSEPETVSAAAEVEVGSAHVADAGEDDLAVVWIERPLRPGAPFRALSRWRRAGRWEEAAPLLSADDGREAWHTNVERRPQGDVVAGWDLGPGGGENQVLLATGRDGRWEPPVDASASRAWGERPHFAFAGLTGLIHAVWFHRIQDRPLHVWHRDPAGALTDLAAGLGGYHFDPDIAVNDDGVLVAVWGWDGGAEADLVYSTNHGQGWSRPARVSGLQGKKPGLPSLAVSPDGRFHVVWAWWVRGQSEVWYASLEV